jgi:hypothetical protein
VCVVWVYCLVDTELQYKGEYKKGGVYRIWGNKPYANSIKDNILTKHNIYVILNL